jgi:hypothetical protein
MLRTVIAKTSTASPEGGAGPEREHEPISPSSSANISGEASTHRSLGGRLDPTYNVDFGMPANGRPDNLTNNCALNYTGAPLGDTVDGMGVITFSDEVASGYFGL